MGMDRNMTALFAYRPRKLGVRKDKTGKWEVYVVEEEGWIPYRP